MSFINFCNNMLHIENNIAFDFENKIVKCNAFMYVAHVLAVKIIIASIFLLGTDNQNYQEIFKVHAFSDF